MTAGRWIVLCGAVLGALGVASGAFSAHALADVLVGPAADTWRTAVQYHLAHAVAMVALGGLIGFGGPFPPGRSGGVARLLAFAGIAFGLGVILFSGSLYALSLGGPAALGPVTPVGGVALMAGWVLLAVAAARG